jgi:hypothetical protein
MTQSRHARCAGTSCSPSTYEWHAGKGDDGLCGGAFSMIHRYWGCWQSALATLSIRNDAAQRSKSYSKLCAEHVSRACRKRGWALRVHFAGA